MFQPSGLVAQTICGMASARERNSSSLMRSASSARTRSASSARTRSTSSARLRWVITSLKMMIPPTWPLSPRQG